MKKILIIDDEPGMLRGLERELRPMRPEWEMHFMEGGRRALEFLAQSPVDVVISDMQMPEMDGTELLTEVSQRHPDTLRIVLSGDSDRESIMRLVGPAHQYLSKPCDTELLHKTIARSFALRDVLTSERVKQLAARVKSLPSLPALYTQVADELNKEEPSVEWIGEIISRDIAMTSKILQLVNSAFFGLPQPLSSAAEAVSYLGLAMIRSLVLSLEIFSNAGKKIAQGFSLEKLADHCWVTGVLARRIARTEHAEEKLVDQCFLAGLLHDVGRLVLASGVPDEYAALLRAADENEATLREAEKKEFGATHAEIGAYLLSLWGLPDPIIEAVAFHHRPADCINSEFGPLLAAHAANAFAHQRLSANTAVLETLLDRAHFAAVSLTDRLADWQSVCLPKDEP